ncbi:MAG: DUF4368 domain-containing protein [Firmicutes bacterium]|nr:DUF4368 domain-containing protein [Bacillota bacterium]
MKKVAIYCRLSDEDRNKVSDFDESKSIQNQKMLLTKYAIENGWSIYKIYSDDDYSGLDKDRPEFKHMINDAKAGKFDIILCKHQSRFSRDMELIERYLHNKFQEWNIRFISVTDNVDTQNKGNKKSRQINGLVNEWYCEDISEAIKATFKVKREKGKFIGSFAPYGYKKDGKDNNRLVIDKEAAEVVRLIFDWYLEGDGTQKIANKLNKRQIPNPTRYKQDKGLEFQNSSKTDGYGLWNRITIRRMLRNEVYIGNLVQGKRKKVNYKSKKVRQQTKDKWIIVENTHEPILDERSFRMIQEKLNNRARSSVKGKPHIFAYKVKCIDCNSTLLKVTVGNKYEYLRCKLYARDPQKKLCTSHSIRLDYLTELVKKKIKEKIEYLTDSNIINKFKEEDEFTKSMTLKEKELDEINKKMKEISLIIKSLYVDKVKGNITEDQFNELNYSFSKEKEELLIRQEKLKTEIRDTSEKLENINRWVELVKKYKGFNELSKVMVNELIDYIEVAESNSNVGEQKIKIHWNF